MRIGLTLTIYSCASLVMLACSFDNGKEKVSSRTPSSPDKVISATYEVGEVSFDELKLSGFSLDKIALVRATAKEFHLLNAKGEAWGFEVGKADAYEIHAPVEARGALFTLDDNNFWELTSSQVERSIKSTTNQIESIAFEFSEQINIADMRILGVDELGVIGLKDNALYVMHFGDSRLYAERMHLPDGLRENEGKGIFAAGMIGGSQLPWVWSSEGLFLKLRDTSGWAKANVAFNGVDSKNIVALGTKVSISEDNLSFQGDLVVLADQKLFKSKNSLVVNKKDVTKDTPNANWDTAVKTIFETSCKSCHSNYASAAAWIVNKCVLIDRINPTNKGSTKTMPPAFAAPAQIDAMNADNDKARQQLLGWLSQQDGTCN